MKSLDLVDIWRVKHPLSDIYKYLCKNMSSKISDFVQSNDTSEVSNSTLWETFKVVVSWQVISYQSSCKRARLRHFSEIESQLSAVEEFYRPSKILGHPQFYFENKVRIQLDNWWAGESLHLQVEANVL